MLLDNKYEIKIKLDLGEFATKKLIKLKFVIPENLVNSNDSGIIDQICANCYKYVVDDIPLT